MCKSCKRYIDSRKTGDKARLIPPDDDDISEVYDHNKIQKNGSVAMAGVANALTSEKNAKKRPAK